MGGKGVETRILLWLIVVIGLFSVVAYLFYTRHPTVSDVMRGKIVLPPAEVEALQGLLADAGLKPRMVRVVLADPEIPCWSHHYRNWLDHKLWVYRQFGRFGDNCIGIDQGHLVSLSLVETRLSEMTRLSSLAQLQQVQLRDARISAISGTPEPCHWTQLVVSQNQITDLRPLIVCRKLRELDVSFNLLSSLPNLKTLEQLEQLHARKNALIDVSGLALHPSLKRLDLTANRLSNLNGLNGLPWLESLHVGSNGLSSLADLQDLPALRLLYAYANRLEEIEPEVTAALPSLRHANLDGNPLGTLPPGYEYTGDGLGRIIITPEDGTIPQVEVNNTPLARLLMRQKAKR